MGINDLYIDTENLTIISNRSYRIRRLDAEVNDGRQSCLPILYDFSNYKVYKLYITRIDNKDIFKSNYVDPNRSFEDQLFKLSILDTSTLKVVNLPILRLTEASMHIICKDYWTLLKNSFDLEKPIWVNDCYKDIEDKHLRCFLIDKFYNSNLSMSSSYSDNFLVHLESSIRDSLNNIINKAVDYSDLYIAVVDDESKFAEDTVILNKNYRKNQKEK